MGQVERYFSWGGIQSQFLLLSFHILLKFHGCSLPRVHLESNEASRGQLLACSTPTGVSLEASGEKFPNPMMEFTIFNLK